MQRRRGAGHGSRGRRGGPHAGPRRAHRRIVVGVPSRLPRTHSDGAPDASRGIVPRQMAVEDRELLGGRGGATSSGLATVYRALDELVARYELTDAALVVDVPGLGRQVLHAGRRPLHNDDRGCTTPSPVSTSTRRSTSRSSPTSCSRWARSRCVTTRGERGHATAVSLDDLELELRRLPGVLAVGSHRDRRPPRRRAAGRARRVRRARARRDDDRQPPPRGGGPDSRSRSCAGVTARRTAGDAAAARRGHHRPRRR